MPLYRVAEYDDERAAKLLFLKLFSGGKFTKDNYRWSSGLHGVGLTVVNALSEAVRVKVKNETGHGYYVLELERGRCVHEALVGGAPEWSTTVTCRPDLEIFKTHRTNIDELPLQLAKDMHPKGSITINGREIDRFDFKQAVDENILGGHTFHVKSEGESVIFDLYFGWSDREFNYLNKGTVNLVPCANGWHERLAKRVIGKALAEYSELIRPDDLYGLRMFVNLFSQDPFFTSQSKDRLSHIGDEPTDFEASLARLVLAQLRKDSVQTEQVVNKLVAYKRQMEKLSDTEFVNSVIRKGNDKRRSMGAGVGIWDCTTRERSKAELFIVEGKSAAGHVRRTRNNSYQAVLPLRGKPLNAAAADDIKVILGAENREGDESELVSMVNCIGAGITPDIDLSAMRYGKILIAADADADGAQISNLILGALIYLVPEVIEAGHVYLVEAPLYLQGGNYYYANEEINTKKPFDRFKGLGSMNPDEVYATIVNPKSRRLKRVVLDDRAGTLEILQTAREKKRIMIQNGVIED